MNPTTDIYDAAAAKAQYVVQRSGGGDSGYKGGGSRRWGSLDEAVPVDLPTAFGIAADAARGNSGVRVVRVVEVPTIKRIAEAL